MPFPKITEIGHALIPPFVQPGDPLVDATCGKGKDTLYLAGLTGPKGLVYAFDIQEKAIEETKKALQLHEGSVAPVRFILDDHCRIDRYVDSPPSVILFNLGYLPGGDHHVTTKAKTTMEAVHKSILLLKKGGLLLLTLYPGHSEGKREADSLERYISRLPSRDFRFMKIAFRENEESPLSPYILAVEKK